MYNVQDSCTPKTSFESYIVDETEISEGKRGATILRDPNKIEEFPLSTCLKKASLWLSPTTDLRIVKIYFVGTENSKFTVYEYHGSYEVETDFQALVDAREAGESVGKVYNQLFKQGNYPPAIAIA